jgi:hypothetical protein
MRYTKNSWYKTLVKATNSFTVVDLAEVIHHAQLMRALWQSGFIYVRVLQTQWSLYNPDGLVKMPMSVCTWRHFQED